MPEHFYKNAFFNNYKPLIKITSYQKSTASKYANMLNRSSQTNQKITSFIKNIFNEAPTLSSGMSICDAMLTLPPLLHTDDHLNMAFGIESRTPFLDHRIVNFALGLPDNMKIKTNSNGNLYLKYIFKEAFRDILPREIYERSNKIGFSSNINDLLRTDLKNIVLNSKAILIKNMPQFDLLVSDSESNPHVRWEYQTVQLAIAYLLYCGKYSQKDVELTLSRDM